MQIENRKLPRKLSRNSSQRSWGDSALSLALRGTQCTIASAAMPKRNPANKNTGNTLSSSFDSPT